MSEHCNGNDSWVCSICCDPSGLPTIIIPRGHSYCDKCLYELKINRQNCPTCRKPIDNYVPNYALYNSKHDDKNRVSTYESSHQNNVSPQPPTVNSGSSSGFS